MTESIEERLCYRAIRLWGGRMDPSEAETLLPFLEEGVSIKVQQTALQVIANYHTGLKPPGLLPTEVSERITELAGLYFRPKALTDGSTRAFAANLLVVCELYELAHPDVQGEWAKLVRHQADINLGRIKTYREQLWATQ